MFKAFKKYKMQIEIIKALDVHLIILLQYWRSKAILDVNYIVFWLFIYVETSCNPVTQFQTIVSETPSRKHTLNHQEILILAVAESFRQVSTEGDKITYSNFRITITTLGDISKFSKQSEELQSWAPT